MIIIKSDEEIELIKKSCEIIVEAFEIAQKLIKPDIATRDIDNFGMVSKLIENIPPTPIPGTDKIATEIFESYLDCMAPLLREEYELVLERLPRLRKWEELDWKETEFYEGPSDCVEGIVRKDKMLFLKGLLRILEIFKRRSAKRKSIQHCSLAITMFILGQRRGFDITLKDIDEKYRTFIPEILVE